MTAPIGRQNALFLSCANPLRERIFSARRMQIRSGAAAIAFFLFFAAGASAQTTYRDPAGNFAVDVPAGWHAQKLASGNGVIISKGNARVSVAVEATKDGSTPPPKDVLNGLEKLFLQNCPRAQITLRADANFAGAPAYYFHATCPTTEHGEATMMVGAGTANGKILTCTSSVPSAEYTTAKPVMNGILQSFRLEHDSEGMPATAGASPPPRKPASAAPESKAQKLRALDEACSSGVLKPGECLSKRAELMLGGDSSDSPPDNEQLQALEKACKTGVLTAEECAAKRAKLTGAASSAAPAGEQAAAPAPSSAAKGNEQAAPPPPQPNSQNAPRPPDSSAPPQTNDGGRVYTDPQGAFSLTLPPGWTAKVQTGCYGPWDYCPQGTTGVNLAQGRNWAFVAMYSGRASRPDDVVVGVAEQNQTEYRNFKMTASQSSTASLPSLAFAVFTALERSGTAVTLLIVGAVAPNGRYYVAMASVPQSELSTSVPMVTSMFGSLRFAGQ